MSTTKPVIYVVGDAMLDADVRLPAYRQVPADPSARVVPVLNYAKYHADVVYAAGGAANVAANAAALGASVTLFAPLGADPAADRLRKQLEPHGVTVRGSWAPGTTTKITYHDDHRPIVRLDDDHTAQPLHPPLGLERPDAVIVTDYGRGSIDRYSAEAWCANWPDVPVYADPKAGRCRMWSHVKGLTALVLNRDEVLDFLPARDRLEEYADPDRAAAVLGRVAEQVKCSVVILKRGQYGSSVACSGPWMAPGSQNGTSDGKRYYHAPPVPPGTIFDLQGAGDSYIAALAVSRARGAALDDACLYASAAAGVAVGFKGTHVVSLADVTAAVVSRVTGRRGVVSYAEAIDLALRLRACGVTVGYTNGCFDLRLTAGHRHTISAAAAGCQFLFVGVDSDARVTKLKGPSRPIVPVVERSAAVADLKGVGAAFVFDDEPATVVGVLKPDVLFKGGHYTAGMMPETPALATYGGRFVHTGVAPCLSTTQLLSEIGTR